MSIKLRCLLLDDELPGLTYLKMLCEQIPELEVVKAFNHPAVFLAESPAIAYDLCILDIEMPGFDGLKVAEMLSGKPVIFTTAYQEHAARAFDIDAIDYLIKPIKKERLIQAVNKAIQRLGSQPATRRHLQVNTSRGKALVFFDQLMLVQTSPDDSRDKIAWLNDDSQLLIKNMSIGKLLAELPSDQFCQVNKQEALNLRVVRFFIQDEITTHLLDKNGAPVVLRLNESYRKDFLTRVQV